VRLNRLLPAAKLVLIALLLVTFAGAARYGVRVVLFPYPLDSGDGVVLDQVLALSRFESIYPADLDSPRLVVGNYPPLYLLAQVPSVWILGPDLRPGRAVSFLAALAAGLLLSLIVHRLTRDRPAGVVTGLLVLSVPQLYYWAPFYRVDSAALALSAAGLLVLVRRPGRPRAVVLAALLLTAAVYTRQSYGLAAPLAGFVFLWRVESRRAALRLAAWMAAVGLGVFALLNLTTGGGFFLNTVAENIREHSARELRLAWGGLFETVPVLLAMAALYLFAGPRGSDAWWLAAPYLLGGALVGLTVGSEGAASNYLFELLAACALIAGLSVSRGPRLLRLAVVAALLLQAGILLGTDRHLVM
jgi:hypothetical protein